MSITVAAFLNQLIPTTITHLHREYPNGLLHQLQGETDVASPAQLHPAFYGCYDWHSAVHSHWQIVRALRLYPNAPFAEAAIVALNQSFTPENLAGELAYLRRHPNFEMPYGMAWVLQLLSELREQTTPQTERWRTVLAPLENHAAGRFRHYLARLPYAIRSGVHNQSAFAMTLALDWARVAGDAALAAQIAEKALAFFDADRDAPLAYEPSGTDFLSPTLAEADLMRRVLPPAHFARWLWQFWGPYALEILPRYLAPLQVVDFSDGQLAHFTGLNLSRAWMLEGIAAALPPADPRRSILDQLAQHHREVGLRDALHPDYMVAHWTPSFALYLLTGRGLPGARESRER
ncbi:MAG: DUF2891 domain-containing protein [Chloroflexi bacterium]|nr:MAG: DUF2891 domain-containing protein [Chloroflexota bacterium]